MKNIVEAIRTETKALAAKTALIEGKRSITYVELLAAVDRMSVQLERCGVRKGCRVALLLPDGIDYIVLCLAALKLYAAIVPVPVASSKEEVETLLRQMKVDFLALEKDNRVFGASRSAKPLRGLAARLLLLARPAHAPAPKEFFALNPAFIRFSSGTTGSRKGVIISHESILQRTDAADEGLAVTSRDTVAWVLSMSFHFVVTILLFLRRGATIILAENSFPDGLLAAFREHRPSLLYASPVHYSLLAGLGMPRTALRGLRLAVSTAVRLPLDVAARFSDKFGFELSEAYGIIEVGLPCINTSRAKEKRGSVGRVLPNYRVRIANAGQDGFGEVLLKGKGLFDAYFSPWRSRQDVMRDGWFHTGDIGRLDADGFLFLAGRENSTINFSGMKIFPEEVEAVINRHPLVRESLVYPVAHRLYGQLPYAKVVVREGGSRGLDPADLAAFCYRHLARYKVPKEFAVVRRLDKTPSGKLRRSAGR